MKADDSSFLLTREASMTRVTFVVIRAALLAGCGAPTITLSAGMPSRSEGQYRPGWTAIIAEHIDAIHACTRDREAPCRVVHLQALEQSKATAVTTVDGFGAVENCSAQRDKVLVRQAIDAQPEDLVGLPSFILGSRSPSVPLEVLLEEVVHQQQVVGWLYWSPQEGASDAP